jgi:hypothetical protein
MRDLINEDWERESLKDQMFLLEEHMIEQSNDVCKIEIQNDKFLENARIRTFPFHRDSEERTNVRYDFLA